MKKLITAIALSLLILPSSLPAQSSASDTRDTIDWWVPALGASVVSSALFFDKPANDFLKENRSPFLNDVSAVTRQAGEKKWHISAILGTTLAGFITGEDDLKQLGVDIGKSWIATGVVTYAGKRTFGRSRPHRNEGPHKFYPLTSDHLSFPSGHTSSAFAVTTPIVEFLKPRVPDALAYSPYVLAGLTGWSRMNDEKHWLSDVIMGAATGVLTSKFVTNEIKIFNFNIDPSLQASSQGAELGVEIKF